MTEPMFSENYSRNAFTIAKGLRAAGYRTGIMGKWHLTSNQDGNYMGLNPKAAHHYGFDFASPMISRREFESGQDRGVDKLTDQALEFIERNRKQPWFCFLSHHMIHGVVVAPEELTEKYRKAGYGDEGPNRAVYLAGLEHIDRSIGRLMKRLDELGEMKESIVMFLSDNGGIHQRLDFKSLPRSNPAAPKFQPDLVEYDNAPLRAGKGSIYEGGIRVPFIAHWPGRIKPGTIIETPVHCVDILPTCFSLALASAPAEHMLDGRSIVRLLTQGSDTGLRERPLYQYYPFYDLRWGLTPNASIRLGDYKLIEFFGDRVDGENAYVKGHRVELYNLRRDIGEKQNLAESETQRSNRMLSKLHHWMNSIGAETSRQNPHFDQTAAFVETREKPDWLRDVKWKSR